MEWVRAAGEMQGSACVKVQSAMMETVLGPQMCWHGRSRERGDTRVDGRLEPWVPCEDVPT